MYFRVSSWVAIVSLRVPREAFLGSYFFGQVSYSQRANIQCWFYPMCDVKGCWTKKGIELRDTF